MCSRSYASRYARSPAWRTLALGAAAAAGSGLAAGGQLLEPAPPQPKRVVLSDAPEGALQPQAVVYERGTVHLVYLKGPSRSCDVFITRREEGQSGWTAPRRVNSISGSAVAAGAVRGAQVALRRDTRLHVVWNGAPELASGNPGGAPLFYTRSGSPSGGFEPQRNLVQGTRLLDGGGSVAADDEGNVYAVWHALGKKGRGETERRLWVSRSSDDGKSFAPETPAYDEPTGACTCCATRALVDRAGTLYVLYRIAVGGLDRDMLLLTSHNHGASFRGLLVDRWRIEACPMSNESFAEGGGAVVAAWETNGQVHCGRIDAASGKIFRSLPAPGEGRNRKHPSVAVNAAGEILLAWNEGSGVSRGGTLAWQVFDRDGRPTRDAGRRPGAIPAWGLSTTYARADGGFVIVY
jgi:hypothetical protein